MKLDSMTNWMAFFSSDEQGYKENNYTLYIYGEGDNSYVVIDKKISDSPDTWDQFVFHCKENKNPLFAFFEFLNKFDFNFINMANAIETYDYVSDEINEVCRIDNIEIARYQKSRVS